MHSPTGEHVDMERERLLGILDIVFEKGHYSPTCGCPSCVSVRRDLSQEDLEFVDHVANLVARPND